MTKPKKKELPDYTLLSDMIENSYKYTLWEHDICTDKEMYKPGSYMMFQFNVTSAKHEVANKLSKFYEAIKHLSNEHVILTYSCQEHGLVTKKVYKVNEVEIYIFDLEKSKETLTEMMRYYKIMCSSVKPMVSMDINMSLIDKSNFNSALDIVRIMK